MDLGKAIKTFRKQKGMTQYELAEKIGLSKNGMCAIEKNGVFPQKENIRKICEALEIPQAYLLFWSIEESDVPENKREIFNVLSEPMKKLLLSK